MECLKVGEERELPIVTSYEGTEEELDDVYKDP